jgi:hypothetical protein
MGGPAVSDRLNLAAWPFDQPEEEQRLITDGLNMCETDEQQEAFLGLCLLADVLVDILTRPPVWREHWWQVWRMRMPR